MTWAQRRKRVLGIETQVSEQCGGTVKFIERILAHGGPDRIRQ
jgi:hypothetical protein